MKHLALLISISTLLVACGGDEKPSTSAETAPQKIEEVAKQAATTPATPDKAALVEDAKTAIKTLGMTLQGELKLAMKNGGPINALDVCNTKAPEIAKAVSTEKDMAVSRVSLKNRNAVAGKANDWQEAILKDFESRKAGGEKPDTLAYADIVKTDDGKQEFRFMKAIPTGGLCLSCHGTEVKPEVSAKIKELYPEDKATGYKEGDLRGAFLVVKQLAE